MTKQVLNYPNKSRLIAEYCLVSRHDPETHAEQMGNLERHDTHRSRIVRNVQND